MGSRDKRLMKQQLAELIEAYAAARVSANRTLLEYAVGQLNDFIARVDVVELKQKEEE
jgi:hypothetical protein